MELKNKFESEIMRLDKHHQKQLVFKNFLHSKEMNLSDTMRPPPLPIQKANGFIDQPTSAELGKLIFA